MNAKINSRLIWVCLSVVVLLPMSTDIYIAGFPAMSQFFATKHIGNVISVYLLGLAVSQPFYGPLLDRFGRRPVLVIGLFIYVVGTALTLLTHNYGLFLSARFIQAIGACSTISVAFAMIHDTWHEDEHALVKAMGILMAIIGIFPAISPFIGSILTTIMGWRLCFYFLFALGFLYLVWTLIFTHETQEAKNVHAMKGSHIWNNYKSLFLRKNYILYSLTSAFSYGVMFAYLTVASLFIVADFGFSMLTLGWVSLVLGGIIFVCSIYVPRLVKKIGLTKTAAIGVTILAFGALLMLICGFVWGSSIYTFVVPMVVVVMGVGFVRPVASAGAMIGVEKDLSGSAAAGFSFVSFIGATICSTLAGFFHATVSIFAAYILLVSILAIISASMNHRHGIQS